MKKRFTLRTLKDLVSVGAAVDITSDSSKLKENNEHWNVVGYSHCSDGLCGLLVMGDEDGKLYAVCSKSSVLYEIY